MENFFKLISVSNMGKKCLQHYVVYSLLLKLPAIKIQQSSWNLNPSNIFTGISVAFYHFSFTDTIIFAK